MNEDWKCHRCGADGYKTDGQSQVWCKKCLGIDDDGKRPLIKPKKIGRNELCPCGSGKKVKRCCALANER